MGRPLHRQSFDISMLQQTATPQHLTRVQNQSPGFLFQPRSMQQQQQQQPASATTMMTAPPPLSGISIDPHQPQTASAAEAAAAMLRHRQSEISTGHHFQQQQQQQRHHLPAAAEQLPESSSQSTPQPPSDIALLLSGAIKLKTHTTGKPPYSYATLITYAILNNPRQQMTLNEIYTWVIDRYPYFKDAGSGWKNSIRHNLSLNKTFVRVPRPINEPGKGAYWAVDMPVLEAAVHGKNKVPAVVHRYSLPRDARIDSAMMNNGGGGGAASLLAQQLYSNNMAAASQLPHVSAATSLSALSYQNQQQQNLTLQSMGLQQDGGNIPPSSGGNPNFMVNPTPSISDLGTAPLPRLPLSSSIDVQEGAMRRASLQVPMTHRYHPYPAADAIKESLSASAQLPSDNRSGNSSSSIVDTSAVCSQTLQSQLPQLSLGLLEDPHIAVTAATTNTTTANTNTNTIQQPPSSNRGLGLFSQYTVDPIGQIEVTGPENNDSKIMPSSLKPSSSPMMNTESHQNQNVDRGITMGMLESSGDVVATKPHVRDDKQNSDISHYFLFNGAEPSGNGGGGGGGMPNVTSS